MPMAHEKSEKETTDVSPVTPGSSLTARTIPSILERDFDSIFDEFRRSFDLMMRSYFPMTERAHEFGVLPVRHAPLDFIDEEDRYIIHAELPGFTREDVEVEIKNNQLSIRAKKESETGTEEEEKHYLYHERAFSAFERSVTFPEEVDPSKAKGTMKNGVLELNVPKKEPKPEEMARKIELT
jgi:HSP20 family protein